MEIYYNIPKDNSHIKNLAFIKAIFIRDTIEKLNITFEEKEELKNEILEYLKKTWKQRIAELESHKKEYCSYEKENNNSYLF